MGGRDREIQIVLDPAALSDYGVSYQRICSVVAANNQTNPSGYVTQEKDEVSLRLMGEFNEVEQLEDILIPTADGQPVPLSRCEKESNIIKNFPSKPCAELPKEHTIFVQKISHVKGIVEKDPNISFGGNHF